MKIRTDFVSNSSSSSFVIDTVDGITDNLSVEVLKKAILMCFKTATINPDTDIRIYDLTSKESFDEAIAKEKDFLKGWQDTMNGNIQLFEETSRVLKDYGKVDFDRDRDAWQQEDKPLQKPIIQTLNILRLNMGVKNMLEVLNDRYGKILICMNENVVFQADGMTDNRKNNFQSEYYSCDRFVELVAKNLWELGYDEIDYPKLKFCFHGNSHQG